MHTPPINPTPPRRHGRPFRHLKVALIGPRPPRPASRRERVTAILLTEPRHDRHGYELAKKLHITLHNALAVRRCDPPVSDLCLERNDSDGRARFPAAIAAAKAVGELRRG